MKLSEIKEQLESAEEKEIPKLLEIFAGDERSSVQKLLQSFQKKYEKWETELIRLEQMKIYEKKYADAAYICGVDEVGRGPLAGPVVTCAVILPKDCNILYINDSKKLSEKKREELYEQIMAQAVDVSIGIQSPQVIDEINILQATYRAMKQAVDGLKYKPDIVLVDAVVIPDISSPQEAIIKGDAKSISIAAASIVAKVTRDQMMCEYAALYPEYDFISNKGYGTPKHIQALQKTGPCPIHRNSFIGNIVAEQQCF